MTEPVWQFMMSAGLWFLIGQLIQWIAHADGYE